MHDLPDQPGADQAGAILTIDLGAIRENYRRLRARLVKASCAAVVKANGYGLGAAAVARALGKEGCKIFFVAHSIEGQSLRRTLGPDAQIFILNGIHPGAEDASAALDLTAVVNSVEQLVAWRDVVHRRGGSRLPVAVQIDSGMSRLGMSAAEVERVAADPRAFDGLDLRLVMSHLACADEPQNAENASQLARFERLRSLLPAAPASLANSSGIFLGEPFQCDLVRPGAALYGINPVQDAENPMRQVVMLHAKVIQTRRLEGGEGVGYGHVFRSAEKLELATIALGYADGWPRHAAAAAWVDGVSLPFVGRVSMDSIVVNASALAPGRLKAGDLVEVIGSRQTVDDVAGSAGTIGYEILTGLGHRFSRRYEGG